MKVNLSAMSLRSERHLKRVWLAITLICYLTPLSAFAQSGVFGDLRDVPRLGEVNGVISFNDSENSYLAVWYRPERVKGTDTDFLVIFRRNDQKYNEVFRLNNDVIQIWQHFVPFGTSRLTGLMIQSSETISDYDWAIVIALVGGEFKVVYRGVTSDLIDLNADGYFEILESSWPDGDGEPRTTTIHVWDGRIYRPLMKVSWNNRFGAKIRAAVSKAARRIK